MYVCGLQVQRGLTVVGLILLSSSLATTAKAEDPASFLGVTVTPHRIEESMRYRRPRDPSLAARVQLFVFGPALPKTFDGKTPAQLLESDQWAWHDMAEAVKPPTGALTVWSFNGKSDRWGVGQAFEVQAEGMDSRTVAIEDPTTWISAVTFLSNDGGIQPDTLVMHVSNGSNENLRLTGVRLWLPKEGASWQVLWPQAIRSIDSSIAPSDRGYIKLAVDKLPLTYAAIELQTHQGSLWSHLRIKRESFDISGGWVHDHLTHESYLNLLQHLHVNTGQIDRVAGYTDRPELYERYPIKLFNRLWPLEQWDTDAWLPRIHAVEFIGEPQYGGGKPMSPQEVFDKLYPYRVSRLPTSVTLSEERTWRWYAGLSDFPHYDAYRVVAPAADAWREYDRWDSERIRWGAPLETIGVLCRSLRELNRPVPCAYWSQGPHDGWGGGFGGGGRSRRSPTPDELRSQAMHALSSRITSLYWFNLSLKSLLQFPDTWEPIARIGREIRMLEPFLLEGDAYHFESLKNAEGSPDWDLATIAAPDAAVLFANDLAYYPDKTENVFRFSEPREVAFSFQLPPWLRSAQHLVRVDADGIHAVKWELRNGEARIKDRCGLAAIYVVANHESVVAGIAQRRQNALDREAKHPIDEVALRSLLKR